jgi:uncharacterized damage-inducible protein DinB
MGGMAAGLLEYYRTFGRYNAWANELIYDAAAKLTPEQYRADRGVFFKSLHGTLNHLLLTDRVWMHRFTGEGTPATRLDAVLYDAFEDLQAARRAEDARIVGYVDGLTDAKIAGTIKFRRVSTPEEFEEPLAPMLAHWFNHQTHHRGQAHAVLTGLTGKAPELDLLFYQRQVAKAAG